LLTANEQAELDSIQLELASRETEAQLAPKGLTPEEAQELAMIQGELKAREDPSFLQNLGEGAMDVIETIDAYTGAPVREALQVGAQTRSIPAAIGAYGRQFGESEGAATGEDVAEAFGVKDFQAPEASMAAGTMPQDLIEQAQELSESEERVTIPAKAMTGMAIEMGADPLVLLPVGKIAKGIGKGVKAGAKMGGRAVLRSSKTAQNIEKGITSTSKTIRETSGAMKKNLRSILRPTQVDDWDRVKDVLSRNKITTKLDDVPEALEFGEHSTISSTSKVLREGPLGEERMKVFNKFLGDVDNAVDSKIMGMADNVGADTFTGGEKLVEGYNAGVKELFDNADVTYKSFNKISPSHMISPKNLSKLDSKLAGIEKTAKGLLKRGVGDQPAKAKQLLKDVEALRRGNGTYKQLVEAMQNVGDVAFKKAGVFEQVPVDRKKLRDIYNTMRDIAFSEVDSIHPDLAKSLKVNNKAFK